MIGCTTSSHKGKTITTPDGKRIFIPQEQISFDRPAPPKIIPYTYNAWMSVGDTLARVREYEVFLERNGVGISSQALNCSEPLVTGKNVVAHNI